MNALGLDVTALDTPRFLATAHALFPFLALAWLAVGLRVRRPTWLLAGIVLANVWVWFVTVYPLQRIYGLGVGRDRLLGLGLVQVTAAGHSPLYGFQVGQLHFEPFWSAFMAVISGWDPERLLAVYPFLPAAMAVGFAVSLYLGLASAPGEGWSAWERLAVAGFATVLSSAPLEFQGTYRVPWTLTFMLKPNHALGLVLLPWVLRAFARISSWRGRLLAGFMLQVLGWVFVLHMVYVAVGLVVFAALSWWWERSEARQDLLDVGVGIGANLLLVSPYLAMLVIAYPFLVRSPVMSIPHPILWLSEGIWRHAPMLLLAAWGCRVAYRRDRLGRLWASVVVAGLLTWACYPLLGALHLARERDEIYYWVRFTTAAMAGVGAWDVLGRIAGVVGRPMRQPTRAMVLSLLVLPLSLPYWWDPGRMDSYFQGSLTPLSDSVTVPTNYVRRHTDPDAVFAGDPYYCRWVAALGARRGLLLQTRNPPDTAKRQRFVRALLGLDDLDPVREAAPRWGVTHLVVTREYLDAFGIPDLASLTSKPHLESLFVHRDGEDYVAIFRLRLEPM